MVTKNFLFVCKSRNTGTVYLSGSLFSELEIQHQMCYLDSIGVDVIDLILVEVDFSKYQNIVEIDPSNNAH